MEIQIVIQTQILIHTQILIQTPVIFLRKNQTVPANLSAARVSSGSWGGNVMVGRCCINHCIYVVYVCLDVDLEI